MLLGKQFSVCQRIVIPLSFWSGSPREDDPEDEGSTVFYMTETTHAVTQRHLPENLNVGDTAVRT